MVGIVNTATEAIRFKNSRRLIFLSLFKSVLSIQRPLGLFYVSNISYL